MWYDDVTEIVECKDMYMIKCNECKRIVRYTPDIRKSYAGTMCEMCKKGENNDM